MLTLYGIVNCDTIKKARSWLEEQGLEYQFHDYRKNGVPLDVLGSCCDEFGFDRVLNQRGTTWRKLPDADKRNIDRSRALDLMQANPSMIKRPILQNGNRYLLGFDLTQYQTLL